MNTWWATLSTRERGIILAGTGLVLVFLLYVFGWQPFQTRHHRLQQTVVERRAELAWMQQAAQDVKALNRTAAAGSSPDERSLLTVVDQTASTAGMGAALKRIAPQGDDKLSAQLDSVEFDRLLPWLNILEEQHRIVLISLTVDRTDTPGLVNARIVLGHQP